MNRAQMRLEVRRALQAVGDTFWSDEEINDWLNEGLAVMCEGSHPIQAFHSFSTSLLPGSTTQYRQEYPMPLDYDQLTRVAITYGGVVTDLKKADAKRFQQGMSGVGVPYCFWTRQYANKAVSLTNTGLTANQINSDNENAAKTVLGLYPCPALVMTVNVWYLAKHFVMTKDDDACILPLEFQRGPIKYAEALGKEKEGATMEADRAMALFNGYKDRLKDHGISSGQLNEFPKVQVTDDEPEDFGEVYLGWGQA